MVHAAITPQNIRILLFDVVGVILHDDGGSASWKRKKSDNFGESC